jgi:hypothetical protein
MKVIGVTAVIVAAILLVIYLVAWIALVAEHGAAEAVRLGLTLWPGNVVGFVLLALIIILGGGLRVLLDHEHQQR